MERRAYPRIETSHAVLYRSNVHPRPKVASTLDLSVGGAKIVTPHSLMAGETLRLSIAIHPEVIECKGEVVHVLWPDGEKLKAGLRFEEISEGDRLYLKQYLFHVMEKQAITNLSPEETPL